MALPGIAIGAGITIGGGIFMGTGSPLTNGSAQFNGVNQYLTGTGSSVLTLDSDFTIEMWINGGAQPNAFPTLIAQNGPWGGNASQCYICVSHDGAPNVISLYNDVLGGDFLNGTTTVTDNAWHHVAVVRFAGVIALYVDGALNGTYASNFTIDYSNFVIGSNPSDGGATTQQLAYQGLISNLRIVKGTAVYEDVFTPPTAPLTATQLANVNGNPSAAVTGTQTSLLLNTYYGAGFLTDSSVNNFTVTNNGSVTSSASNPF